MNHSNIVDSRVSAQGLPTPQMSPGARIRLRIEAGRTEKHYWRDCGGFANCSSCSGVARHCGTLQTDCRRGRVGLVQPLLSMIIMTVIFGKVAGLPSVGKLRITVMVFAAILPWQFF